MRKLNNVNVEIKKEKKERVLNTKIKVKFQEVMTMNKIKIINKMKVDLLIIAYNR
jgi:hypothetical protein